MYKFRSDTDVNLHDTCNNLGGLHTSEKKIIFFLLSALVFGYWFSFLTGWSLMVIILYLSLGSASLAAKMNAFKVKWNKKLFSSWYSVLFMAESEVAFAIFFYFISVFRWSSFTVDGLIVDTFSYARPNYRYCLIKSLKPITKWWIVTQNHSPLTLSLQV